MGGRWEGDRKEMGGRMEGDGREIGGRSDDKQYLDVDLEACAHTHTHTQVSCIRIVTRQRSLQ